MARSVIANVLYSVAMNVQLCAVPVNNVLPCKICGINTSVTADSDVCCVKCSVASSLELTPCFAEDEEDLVMDNDSDFNDSVYRLDTSDDGSGSTYRCTATGSFKCDGRRLNNAELPSLYQKLGWLYWIDRQPIPVAK